jgi:hypothetical protein
MRRERGGRDGGENKETNDSAEKGEGRIETARIVALICCTVNRLK